MKKMDKILFIKLFCQYNTLAQNAMSKNNYKENNKLIKKRNKMILDNCNQPFFKEALLEMLESDNINISFPTAVQCLSYKFEENKALDIIKSVSKRTDMGVAALEAEMTLKMYNGEIPNRTLSNF